MEDVSSRYLKASSRSCLFLQRTTHGIIFFKDLPIVKENMCKNLFLEIKLILLAHINKKIKKANKGIIKTTQPIITT